MYEKALERDSAHVPAWLNLAKATYELGDYSRAAQCFLKAYELRESKNPEHLYHAAVAYLMAREYRQSITVFDTLLSCHPADVRHAWRETFVHALLSRGLLRRRCPIFERWRKPTRGKKRSSGRRYCFISICSLTCTRKHTDMSFF